MRNPAPAAEESMNCDYHSNKFRPKFSGVFKKFFYFLLLLNDLKLFFNVSLLIFFLEEKHFPNTPFKH